MVEFKTISTILVWSIVSIFLIGILSSGNSLGEIVIIIFALIASPFIVYTLMELLFRKKPEKNGKSDIIESKNYVVYSEYINSPEWIAKKNLKLKDSSWKCEVCGNKASEVHHFSHKTLARETMADMIAVCSECHSKLENEKLEERKKKLLEQVST